MENTMKMGKVYIAGAGCGDFDLMTLKLKSLIEESECIVYDRLVNKEILKLAPCGAELIYLGKEDCEGGLLQEEINATLIKKAKEGKDVLRLKGGHPFVFGRGGEEALALVAEDIKFDIIPGVTSAISVPAYAGIPVSHRGINTSFHIFTGHTKKDGKAIDYETVAKLEGTLVFLMGVKNIGKISSGLINNGKISSTPVAVIENGSTCHQRTVVGTLETITKIVEEEKVKSPSIIIVGEVVNLREQLSWFENKTLHGQKVLVTAEKSKSKPLSRLIRSLGGESMEFPLFEMSAIDFNIPNLKTFNTIAFTSPQSVHAFFKKIDNIRDLNHLSIGVAGEKTHEALKEYKLTANIKCKVYRTSSMLSAISHIKGDDDIILLVTSSHSYIDKKEYKNPIYQLETYQIERIMRAKKVVKDILEESSIVTFSNACTAQMLLDAVDGETKLFTKKQIVALNKTTADKLELLGLHVNAIGDNFISEKTFEECMLDKEKGIQNNDMDYRGNKGFTHPCRKAG